MNAKVDAVVRACRVASSEVALFEAVSDQLHDLVPFDGAAWFATDPATLLGTSAVRVENIGTGHCESYWERECLVEDALLFRDVARSSPGVGTLYDVTGNRPASSARFREYLAPQGYGDELRAAFRLGTTTWGVLDLYRERSRAPFTAGDREQIQQIVPPVARALRAFAAGTRSPAAPAGPGTALFDARGTLLSLDAQAEILFAEIGGPDWRAFPATMTPVHAITARATAVVLGRDPGPAVTRLRAASGRWLSLHASRLRGPDGSPGPTAVTVEPARAEQIAPILVAAHALTPREQQVTRAVARGLTSQEIAAELFLSPHTVRDYLKTIFAKVGVSSRGELVATVFAYPANEG
ncbi:response regulator transcription factor [Cryptosporangium phraense]|uniref:Helix-turn-helix transcriptional regulator n=1 Tax=Cryptosporangium phraense TaxID=2593070 RepID=A0A545AIM6_9ACTN|nr:helix-turn-helix transcriptional regulator [Cryptosporangium phraense]TQS41174.1 helix-turn-helix transcriptional regulator [Cryptosporangium phraense]